MLRHCYFFSPVSDNSKPVKVPVCILDSFITPLQACWWRQGCCCWKRSWCNSSQLRAMPRTEASRVLLCSSLGKTVVQPKAPQRAAVPPKLLQHWLSWQGSPLLLETLGSCLCTLVQPSEVPVVQDTCASHAPVCYKPHTHRRSSRMLNTSSYQKREKKCYCLW